MDNKRIKISQLDEKFKFISSPLSVTPPSTGWIKAVRLALGMTLQQLANRLHISKQSAMDVERREKEGSVTLKTLRETANALDMELIYGLVPKDGSLELLIDRKARILAEKIVSRTSNTMKLEDQENSKKRIKKAIDERVVILKHEIPKILWD
jgi:predicted DNA-binding mobile mystery protein A